MNSLIPLYIFVGMAYGQMTSSTNPVRLNYDGIVMHTKDYSDNVQSGIYPLPKGTHFVVHADEPKTSLLAVRSKEDVDARDQTHQDSTSFTSSDNLIAGVNYYPVRSNYDEVAHRENYSDNVQSRIYSPTESTSFVDHTDRSRTPRPRRPRPRSPRPRRPRPSHNPSSGINYFIGSTHIGSNFQTKRQNN